MKHLSFFLLFLITYLGIAQNFEDEWKGFFSYVSVKSITQGNDKLFVGAENAVFSFDLSTQEIKTISTINGLSGELISTVYYSVDYRVLFVGYENGLIDVVIEGEEDVLKVVDILEKPTIPPNKKRINQFYEYDEQLYIATDYGISVYDIDRLEFGDTYFIGELGAQIQVSQTTVLETYIYASTQDEGLKRARIDSGDLIDFAEWQSISGGAMVGVQTVGENLFFARLNNLVLQANVGVVATFNSPIVDFYSDGETLTITTENSINAYDSNFNLLSSVNFLNNLDDEFQSGISLLQNFYIGTSENGLLRVPFGSNQYDQILPDGPILNNPFSIDASPGQLWVTFGDITQTSNPFPLDERGISNLREETWTNIPFEDLFGATDIVKVIINPNNPNEVYMSSYMEGLLKIEDQTPVFLFNETNSALDEAILPPNNSNAGIRLYGSEFDREGNLWVVQSLIDEGILKLTPSQQIQKVDISDIIEPLEEQALRALDISREGHIFIATTNNGVIGYNTSTNTFNKIGEGLGQGNLPRENVKAVKFDASNRLWIGTTKGLRVLFNVGGFFDAGTNIDAQQIIILDDGVPQELLFEQTITDIEVDGSNNKWIATSTSGVFYLSANGQETLLRFTKSNSPLPSNNVQDIAIDDSTGRVYFATVNGLVAFEGTSTAPRDNLENVYAFPNPVRPGFTGNVTIDGLTADANVKITDIEGNLVFETTSQGGSVLWDTSAFGKYKVASGVYMVLITSDDQLETKVTKIMVIR
ncbi:T9SS type A sorting domain-containing protein [Aureisphaera sp. CAU 1614]|uniref:T9SS type A sorting domain-containing protein n=1 Tax=Halomarinibacterium sedimenti TaxID=2857106 RepID=A0A9X1FQ43_9FLAO|nr:T9SS type A sorting domain-containing protein [Halomarinibacterium sedimenti]MBW2938460.1 T9SS type A sorting domain-containing protein [Halomarinibacterium sedimenti]